MVWTEWCLMWRESNWLFFSSKVHPKDIFLKLSSSPHLLSGFFSNYNVLHVVTKPVPNNPVCTIQLWESIISFENENKREWETFIQAYNTLRKMAEREREREREKERKKERQKVMLESFFLASMLHWLITIFYLFSLFKFLGSEQIRIWPRPPLQTFLQSEKRVKE